MFLFSVKVKVKGQRRSRKNTHTHRERVRALCTLFCIFQTEKQGVIFLVRAALWGQRFFCVVCHTLTGSTLFALGLLDGFLVVCLSTQDQTLQTSAAVNQYMGAVLKVVHKVLWRHSFLLTLIPEQLFTFIHTQ